MTKLSEIYAHKNELKQIKKKIKDMGIDAMNDVAHNIDGILSACEWYEKWGIDKVFYTGSISRLDENAYTCLFREIPNMHLDQPIEMLNIWFSTGPYIFGDDYDSKFFNEFFETLRNAEPKPDHVDMLNKSLYYKPEKAKEAYASYKKILKEYNEKNVERTKKARMEKLRKELEQLEGE